jgi:hypothetical protein
MANVVKINSTLVATKSDDQIDNLHSAAQEDVFQTRLKFVKGEYLIDKEVITTDSQYLAYPKSWTKEWIKWVDGQPVERKLYVAAKGEIPPERDELDEYWNKEKSKKPPASWRTGPDGKPTDPWQLHYYLPLENLKIGDLMIFTTTSTGGHKAVAELVDRFTRRSKQIANCGQPIVELATTKMPTKDFGKVLRPKFNVVGWDDPALEQQPRDVFDGPPPAMSEDDFNDPVDFK